MSATADMDYASVAGVITFAPGETSKVISVPVLNDILYEHREAFRVILGEVHGGTVLDGVGVGQILDDGTGWVPPGVAPDNDMPHLIVRDLVVNEATGEAVYAVTLSNPSSFPVSVNYTTEDLRPERLFNSSASPSSMTAFTRGRSTLESSSWIRSMSCLVAMMARS
jgi:hypothetical protein